MQLKLDPFAPNGVSMAQPAGAAVVNASATLSDTGVTAGTYGDATNVGQFTVDSTGRITTVQNVVITASGSSINYATLAKLGLGAF